MIDGRICYQTQAFLAVPFPVNDIFQHRVRVDLQFLPEIEDLQRPLLCLECNDLFSPMHDGTIGLNRSLNYIIIVLEIDYDDFRTCALGICLSNTDIMVGFESLGCG